MVDPLSTLSRIARISWPFGSSCARFTVARRYDEGLSAAVGDITGATQTLATTVRGPKEGIWPRH